MADVYDDRPEVEKDIWDLHKMGLEVNMASTAHRLNFTLVSQPWLRDLAKAYMHYNVAVHSAGDCIGKMTAINAFSHFLAQKHPHLGIAGLDRALIVEYIGYLRDRQVSDSWEGCWIARPDRCSRHCYLGTALPALGRHPRAARQHGDDEPGGYKQSGLGRELGMHALNLYTEVKNIYINLA